ncbi:helix-turn-helix transcriptional regulator [Sphingomonas xanthus]|nr:helix-turn-helix transcriptional regulator [Sphingomonas xanthus]
MIVTRSGSLVAITDAARQMLEESRTLGIRGDRLHSASSSRLRILAELLEVDPDQVRTCLIDDRENGHLVCRSVALPDCGDKGLVFVEIVAAQPDVKAHWVDFRVSHGMTDCENEVLASLMSGECPLEIAEHMGSSVNTVRTHIRHIYEKVGVSNVQELHRKLAAYRLG